MSNESLQAAVRLAALGWRTVPIRRQHKYPPMREWQKAGTCDPTIHVEWWEGEYDGCGIGICTGQQSGVWVLDVDPDEGGLATLRDLVAEHGQIPKGPKARTAGGGFHLFFRNPEGLEVVTTKNLSGSGLDVRGDGGQVVAAPTPHPELGCKRCRLEIEHDKDPYRWERAPWDTELPDAPEWLVELVRRPDPAVVSDRVAPPHVDDLGYSAAAEICAAYDWHQLLLSDGWTIASTQPNGDTHWTRPGKDARAGVSAILHEPDGPFVNYSTNAENLCQPWAQNATGDGWAFSIYGYISATRHGGNRSAAAQEWSAQRQRELWDEWVRDSPPSPNGTADDETTADFSWAHLIDWDEFWTQDHTAQDWLVWPLVPRGRQVALFAEAKAGKSTIVLAAVAAACVGRSVLGHWEPPEPVTVLYLDYEMTDDDLWERLDSLGYGPDEDWSRFHYALLPSIAPLDTEVGAAQVVALAKHLDADLVIVDTFGRAVQGEENNSDTYRGFYRHTGLQLKQAGIACLRTDHAGKDADRGQRGSSSKNDDVDIVWKLERTDGGVSIARTHSRISWAESEISIEQIEQSDGGVDYRVARRRSWPEGTHELAALLQRLDVPLDASVRQATQTLRAAGEHPKFDRVRAAQQFRTYNRIDEWRLDDTDDDL